VEQAIRVGGPLHDVGKLAVSEEILRKRGPLDPDEVIEIRKHPVTGAKMLGGIRSLRIGIDCVLHHHERWDGDGYPYGLAGAAIPFEARIVAVADAFDAMISDRPYRAALAREAALAEVGRCSGAQFDPQVAVALLAIAG
jgi:HD-GYP domain-containing protein (c-di-GMP phosphodiesterase class II)